MPEHKNSVEFVPFFTLDLPISSAHIFLAYTTHSQMFTWKRNILPPLDCIWRFLQKKMKYAWWHSDIGSASSMY